jgi:hypothetical protein
MILSGPPPLAPSAVRIPAEPIRRPIKVEERQGHAEAYFPDRWGRSMAGPAPSMDFVGRQTFSIAGATQTDCLTVLPELLASLLSSTNVN